MSQNMSTADFVVSTHSVNYRDRQLLQTIGEFNQPDQLMVVGDRRFSVSDKPSWWRHDGVMNSR